MSGTIPSVRPGEAISAARFNEVVAALNEVSRISGSYPIEIQRDAAGVRIALAHDFKAWLFRIQEVPDPIPRTSDGVAHYQATRLRLDGSDEYAPQDPQDVRLYDPLAQAAAGKDLAQGTWVLAAFNADTGRWEIVRDPSAASLVVRFRLTTTLALGGSASAVIRTWNGTAYTDGVAITVQDFSGPGRWSGVNGAEGVAAKLPDKSAYEILWVEHSSVFVKATLTSSMSGGRAAATIDDAWQGAGAEPSGTDVYDALGYYGDAVAGDRFICAFDDRAAQRKYRIIEGPRAAAQVKWAYLTTDHLLASQALSANHKASAQQCDDSTGTNPHGAVFDLFLPSYSEATEPNAQQGSVIPYVDDPATGRHVAVGGGYLDDARGTIKNWSSANPVPHGWNICDGTNGTVDLRDKFVVGVGTDTDFDGQGHGTNEGAVGGAKAHNHPPLAHRRLGSANLITEEVELKIRANTLQTSYTGPGEVQIYFPGYTGFATGETGYWRVEITGPFGVGTVEGYTDPATLSDRILIYDPANPLNPPVINGDAPVTTEHPNHYHETYGYACGPGVANGVTVAVDPSGTGTSYTGTMVLTLIDNSTVAHACTVPQDQYGTYQHVVYDKWIDDLDHSKGRGHFHRFSVNFDQSGFRGIEAPPGHKHDVAVVFAVPPMVLGELPPGHRHQIVSATIEDNLWIEDRTHTQEDRNKHYHELKIDDHTISSKNHIPPYYALMFIQRVN
ncbi:MAG: hypothetical protein HYX69_18675 [Planctomycetia bacterium]|nr:hypothetical protein [Planctomycetia bacterium]